MKYSPAPWVNRNGIVDDANGRCMFEGDIGDAENDADLIAASPKLFEALQNLLFAIEGSNAVKRGDYYHERKMAKIALSQAEGK